MTGIPVLIAQRPAPPAAQAAAAGLGIVFLLIYLVMIAIVLVPTLAGMWKVFTKAGKPGWAAIIPFYNEIVLVEISGKPMSWAVMIIVMTIIFCLFPVAAVLRILTLMDLAKRFGKDPVYGLGLAFLAPIFFPMLGFGSARYRPGRAADRYEDEDDFEDRPRRRRPTVEDDEEDDRPRRRRPVAEDDDEDRPRRRRRRVEDDD